MTGILETPASIGSKGQTMKKRLVSTALGVAVVAILPGLPAALSAATPHMKAKPRALAVLHTTPPMTPGVTAPARSLAISIGRGELVTLPGNMTDVFVANENIADVQVKSGNQLYIFGKAGGETTVYASNGRGDVIWSANIRVGNNLDSIDQMLHMAMPEAHIATATMNNTVLLTGTVSAPEDAAEAERLVKAFVGEKTNVISRLKMATPLQVNLHVKFAEVSRTLTRSIQSNWTTADATSGLKFGLGQGRSFFPQYVPGGPLGMGTATTTGATAVSPVSTGTTLALASKVFGLSFLAALDLAESIGLVSTLAEPNLTALSGETAEFLAGGEYPIPVSSGLGTVPVQYKNYGVSLAYTPTVLANGRISLRVRPEVSELSSDGAVSLNGYSVPALSVRRAETTIELGSGQSFMIAGLLKNSSQNTIAKMPGAGDLPILGSLFRSTSYQRGETELVIIVTPYLVNPVDPSEIHLPTDGFKSAGALKQILGNLESDGVVDGERPKPTEKPATQQSTPATPAPSPAPAAPEQAASPRIGDASGASAPDTADRPRRGKQASNDTQPGFSIQ
ncbi:type II and III secretion system protein [Novosphingobium nitrogenifigens DSM 19370]|uniref:Type II and III secretion system protein n=1 Tax=Novosphingobium nitrogenifigens DSM 19370 TaxID=983920 RepID=F1ZDG0_9SPHN|nr:type II and III secretion system protein family protein [Novosphingobium nitrogenifigens]EGD57299.1 type II and III secretion system protein [Novosphingobium nitrogenifigens DSM 19370]